MSEYLTEEEQLARLRNWWQRNGLALLVGVVLIVAAVVGWRWYQGYMDERTVAASDLYIQFQQAEGDARGELAQRILDEGAGTGYPALVLLHQAQTAVAADEGAAAEPLLQQAAEAATAQELADLAWLRLARVRFELERPDDALAALAEVKGSGYRSLTAELKGDIHLAQGDRTLAHQSYTAAQSYVQAGDQRPVLEMKIADTADAASP